MTHARENTSAIFPSRFDDKRENIMLELEIFGRSIPEIEKLKAATSFLVYAKHHMLASKIEYCYLFQTGDKFELIKAIEPQQSRRVVIERSEIFPEEIYLIIFQSVIEMGGLNAKSSGKLIIIPSISNYCWIKSPDGRQNAFNYYHFPDLKAGEIVYEIEFYFRDHDQKTLSTFCPPNALEKLTKHESANWVMPKKSKIRKKKKRRR